MKTFLTIVFILTSVCLFASEIDANSVRSQFVEAAQDHEKRASFVESLESSNSLEKTFQEAYLGASLALLAECSYAPWVKYGHFNTGTNKLEQAIAADPLCAEYRFLRFMIQINAPSFLDYDLNITEDYAHIERAIAKAERTDKKESWMLHFDAFVASNKAEIRDRTDITF